MVTVRLYTRTGCHLCDEAAAALGRLAVSQPHRLETIDIDREPALRERYGCLVPVIVVEESWRLITRIDEAALREVLRLAQDSASSD